MGKNVKVGLAAAAIVLAERWSRRRRSQARGQFESHIGISAKCPAFHGDVDAEEQQCVPHRIVRLYRVRDNHDKLLGQDQTDVTGKWEISEASDGFILKSGGYYAKVNASFAGDGDRCTKDKSSKIVSVD